MELTWTNLGGHMAAAVDGVNFRAPPSADLATTPRQALWDNQVLCICG